MLKTILRFYELAEKMLDSGLSVAEIRSSPVIPRISRMKDITNDAIEVRIKELWADMEASLVVRNDIIFALREGNAGN